MPLTRSPRPAVCAQRIASSARPVAPVSAVCPSGDGESARVSVYSYRLGFMWLLPLPGIYLSFKAPETSISHTLHNTDDRQDNQTIRQIIKQVLYTEGRPTSPYLLSTATDSIELTISRIAPLLHDPARHPQPIYSPHIFQCWQTNQYIYLIDCDKFKFHPLLCYGRRPLDCLDFMDNPYT
ncbi:hypothetical protein J6590_005582 [Homalodisca vitripennis]|nr:hypothetical protein J6590_005582 [Homalodisca vitripennis]